MGSPHTLVLQGIFFYFCKLYVVISMLSSTSRNDSKKKNREFSKPLLGLYWKHVNTRAWSCYDPICDSPRCLEWMPIHSNKTSFVMARSEGYYHLANLKKMTVEKHDSRHVSHSLESLRRWKNRNIRKKSDTVKPANLMILCLAPISSNDFLKCL